MNPCMASDPHQADERQIPGGSLICGSRNLALNFVQPGHCACVACVRLHSAALLTSGDIHPDIGPDIDPYAGRRAAAVPRPRGVPVHEPLRGVGPARHGGHGQRPARRRDALPWAGGVRGARFQLPPCRCTGAFPVLMRHPHNTAATGTPVGCGSPYAGEGHPEQLKSQDTHVEAGWDRVKCLSSTAQSRGRLALLQTSLSSLQMLQALCLALTCALLSH